MPPKRSSKVPIVAKGPAVSIQKGFDSLSQHLRESRKDEEHNKVISLPNAAIGLRNVLAAHRKKKTSIEQRYIDDLVSALEGGHENICCRLSTTVFVVLVETILQTDYCIQSERGLYLLAASLHQDNLSNERERVKKRREAVGSLCLNLLFSRFVDIDGPPELRRWIGILCIQLLKGCKSNIDLVGVGSDRTREGLGQMLKTENNEIVKCLAGKVIDIIGSSGSVALQTLWPKNTTRELIEKFPRSSQDGWSQKFQEYLEETSSVENEKQAPSQMLYFATDCLLKPPEFQLGRSGHTLTVTMDYDFLTVHVPSSDQWPDQIFQIPIPSIFEIAVRDEAETQNGFSGIYVLIGVDFLCILNGKEEDVSSARLRGPPDFAEALKADIAGASTFVGNVNNVMDVTEFDTDDDTNSYTPQIKISQDEMMIGSEIGSVNFNSLEQLAIVDEDCSEEDLYNATPQKTQTTRSPEESEETKEVLVGKNKNDSRHDRQEVASQSKSKGSAGFSERGPFPSKSQARADARMPAAVSSTKLAAKPKPKTTVQGKVGSQTKKSEVVGKRPSPARSQAYAEIENPAAASNVKLVAKSAASLKFSKHAQSNTAFQADKSHVLADVNNKIPRSEQQPAPTRRKSMPKTKSKAKAPITQPMSKTRQSQPRAEKEGNKPGGVSSPAIDSVDFDVSDEHNFSTPKTFQAVKNPHKMTPGFDADADQSQGQLQKMTTKVLISSKENAQQDEYDLPTASDDEESVYSSTRKKQQNSRSKKGLVKYQGAKKTQAKKVLCQKKALSQDKPNSTAKSATGGMLEKASTTKPSQVRNGSDMDELQAPPPRMGPPRSSQVANESNNSHKASRASKIPIPSGKGGKSPVQQSETPINVENEYKGKKTAPIKRISLREIVESNEGDHEAPQAEFEGENHAAEFSDKLPLQEAKSSKVPKELVSFEQIERETTERNAKLTNKRRPKEEVANQLSLLLAPLEEEEAHFEDIPENESGLPAEKVVAEDDEEPRDGPMDGSEDRTGVEGPPKASISYENISPMEASIGGGSSDPQGSRKRKAEVGEPTSSKKRRSLTQAKARNVSALQDLDSQSQNKNSNKPASEHAFKKPVVQGKLQVETKAKPLSECRDESAGSSKASSFNKSTNTPSANERGGSAAATGESNASVLLVDDSAHRKANIIAFNKSGPINQGRASITPKPHVESVPRASLQKDNPPAKRKLDNVEIWGVESPPSKRRQSSLIYREDEEMADVNFEDAVANSSSAVPASLFVATKVTRKRLATKPSSQSSRVDLNGSPLPLNASTFTDNLGIDEKIKEFRQAKHHDVPMSQRSFKPDRIFGPKAKIGSQNKARPSSPEKIELRYILHHKTKNGNYQGIVGKEVVEPQILADPFVEQPPTRKSSGFTDRLRTETGTKAGNTGAAVPAVEKVPSIPRPQGAQTSKIKSGRKRMQVYVDDPEKTLVEGAGQSALELSVPSMCSDSSNGHLSSDPVRSPLEDISGNETWNVALRPHYTNLKDAVHRVADEMIIRLANEEDRMELLVKQYQEGGAKIVDDLVEKRTQEKKKIAQGLLAKKSAMVKAYKASGKAIAKVVEATKNNSVTHFTEGWKAKQAAIREKIRRGREGS